MERIKGISPATATLLSVAFGLVLWGVQGYIFGYANLRWLTYPYVAFFAFYFFIIRRHAPFELYKLLRSQLLQNKRIMVLIAIGVIIQLIPVFGSGFLYKDGVRLFGVNGTDGVMHLAFIRSMVSYFPPVEPGASGHALTNYHYWSDLIIADVVRIWMLPITHSFFQYFPFLISLLTGIAAYKVVRIFGWSKTAGVWSLFFLYFAGDAAYALMLLVHQYISFSAPAIDNGATQFLNMPHAMAKMVFLTSLIPLHFWLTTKNKSWGVVTIVMFAVLAGLKIYFGFFAIIGFCLIILYQIIRSLYSNKKHGNLLFSLQRTIRQSLISVIFITLLGVVSLLIYLPPNSSSGGLVYYPLEWPKIFLGPGALNWGEWWLRHQVYEQAKNYRNLFILDMIAIIITLISVHGTRLIGLFPNIKMYKKLGWEKLLFFVPGIILFHLLGLYTLQVSGGFNVFNFFAVSTVGLSLFSSFLLSKYSFSRSLVKNMIIILIIILTVPRVAYETYRYSVSYFNPEDDSRLINRQELNALHFMREKTDKYAIVQSHPNNPLDHVTPYVSFFTDRQTYLTGVGVQETHNQPIGEKKELIKAMFSKETEDDFVSEMRKNHIYYIYLQKVKDQELRFSISDRYVDIPYENDFIKILSLKEQYRGE